MADLEGNELIVLSFFVVGLGLLEFVEIVGHQLQLDELIRWQL